MPALSSSLTVPVVGHLADLAEDAAREPPGLLAVRAGVSVTEVAEFALSEAARGGGATWAQIAAARGARGRQGAQKRHADLSRRYPRPPRVDSTAPVTRAPEPPEPAAASERAPARRPAARPSRAGAPRRERAASRSPRITPAIISDGRYKLVKSPDHAESRAWHVMIGRRRAGLVCPTWRDGETVRAWEAVDLSGEVLQVTGTGRVTRASNARNRNAAAISLLSALLRAAGAAVAPGPPFALSICFLRVRSFQDLRTCVLQCFCICVPQCLSSPCHQVSGSIPERLPIQPAAPYPDAPRSKSLDQCTI
jgi:hypothetical protein